MKYLLSTLVLVFALSTAMAQSTTKAPATKKEAVTATTSTSTTATADHKCEPGCKKDCCAKKDAKACDHSKKDAKACSHAKKGAAGCSHAKAANAAEGEKHACAPGCTMPCCAAKTTEDTQKKKM